MFGTYEDRLDTALGDFAQEKAKAVALLKGKSKKEQEKLAADAMNALRSLPPTQRQMAEEVLMRAGTPVALGTGAASTINSVANIIATVGSIGLSIYGMTEARKEAERQEEAAKRQQAAEAARIEAQIEESKRQQAALVAQAATQPQQQPSAFPGGLDPKILMIAGGALVTVLLVAKK